jgi:hypothetical protein
MSSAMRRQINGKLKSQARLRVPVLAMYSCQPFEQMAADLAPRNDQERDALRQLPAATRAMVTRWKNAISSRAFPRLASWICRAPISTCFCHMRLTYSAKFARSPTRCLTNDLRPWGWMWRRSPRHKGRDARRAFLEAARSSEGNASTRELGTANSVVPARIRKLSSDQSDPRRRTPRSAEGQDWRSGCRRNGIPIRHCARRAPPTRLWTGPAYRSTSSRFSSNSA